MLIPTTRWKNLDETSFMASFNVVSAILGEPEGLLWKTVTEKNATLKWNVLNKAADGSSNFGTVTGSEV